MAESSNGMHSRISGTPYSAEFIPVPNGGDEEISHVFAVIEPPFSSSSEEFYDAVPGIEVNHRVTTISKTVLHLRVDGVRDGVVKFEHDERIGKAYETVHGIVETLNIIEAGQIDPMTF